LYIKPPAKAALEEFYISENLATTLRGKFNKYLINKIGKLITNNIVIVYNTSNLQNKFSKYLFNKINKFDETYCPSSLFLTSRK
jgi:hypothetical protein